MYIKKQISFNMAPKSHKQAQETITTNYVLSIEQDYCIGITQHDC